jgi:hypothetical protein
MRLYMNTMAVLALVMIALYGIDNDFASATFAAASAIAFRVAATRF